MAKEKLPDTSPPTAEIDETQGAFVETEPHRRALAHLRYGLRQGEGVVILTGDEGTGKTAVLTALIASCAGDDDQLVVTVDAADLDPDGFEARLLDELHAQSTVDESFDLRDALRAIRDSEMSTAVIVDNAHALTDDGLDAVRRLVAEFHEGEALVQMTLAGRTPLRRVLYRDDMDAFRQKVSASFHLPVLTQNETRDYIVGRLSDLPRELTLADDAFEALFRESSGNPAMINRILAAALLRTDAAKRDVVTIADIRGDGAAADEQEAEDAEVVTPADEPAPDAEATEARPRGPVSVSDLNAAIEQLGRTPDDAVEAPEETSSKPDAEPDAENGAEDAAAATASEDQADDADDAVDTSDDPRVEAIESFVGQTRTQLESLRASLEALRGEIDDLDDRRKIARRKFAGRLDGIRRKLDTLGGGD